MTIEDSKVEEQKKAFLESFKKEIGGKELPRPCGQQMVVRVYERDKGPIVLKDEKGDVILDEYGNPKTVDIVDRTLEYDRDSNNVGQVIAFGPDAYKNTTHVNRFSSGPYCKIGDWIMFPASSGSSFLYCGIPCRLMYEDKCLMVVDDPSYISRT